MEVSEMTNQQKKEYIDYCKEYSERSLVALKISEAKQLQDRIDQCERDKGKLNPTQLLFVSGTWNPFEYNDGKGYPFLGEVLEGEDKEGNKIKLSVEGWWYYWHPTDRTKKVERELVKNESRFPERKKVSNLVRTIHKNDHFRKVKPGLLNMAGKSFRNPLALLIYLLEHSPFVDKTDKYNTWGYWYVKRGLIVVSVGEEKMAVDLGVDERTIKRWVKQLNRDGVIITFKSGLENLYILGVVQDNVEKHFYCGEIKTSDVSPITQDNVVP
jgi:hypothetical protein